MSRKSNEREAGIRRANRQLEEKRKRNSRRAFIRNVLIVGGIVVAGRTAGVSLLVGNNREDDNKLTAEKAKIDATIRKLDNGMDRLEEMVSEKLIGPLSSQQALLLRPFQLYRANKNNVRRNKKVLEIEVEATRVARGSNEASSPYQIEDSSYFFIDIYDKSIKAEAAYAPADKTLYANESFSPSRLFDLLVLYHEMFHALQDTDIRRTFQSQVEIDRYLDFFDKDPDDKHKIVGLAEQQAYLAEIMVLNLLTDGELERDVTPGVTDELVTSYANQLGVGEFGEPGVKFLLDAANAIYTTGTTMLDIKPGYANFIDNEYRELGWDIYGLTDTGELIHLP